MTLLLRHQAAKVSHLSSTPDHFDKALKTPDTNETIALELSNIIIFHQGAMSANNPTMNFSRRSRPTFQPPNLSLFPQTGGTGPGSDIVDLSKFIFHYNILGNGSVQDTLSQVTNDLASHNDLHDWDEDLCPDPVKRLAVFAKHELSQIQVDKADYMVNFNLVQEVKTTNGANFRRYIPRNASDAASQLFPSTLDMVRGSVRRKLTNAHSMQAQDTTSPNSRTIGPRLSHGRVV